MNLSFKDTLAVLNGTIVNLAAVASFVDDVYRLGLHSDPKAYTQAARKHVAAIDKQIVNLATHIAIFSRTDAHDTQRLIQLASIRNDVEGHRWRADRITEREVA
jgi:hypothetical protein